MDILDGIGVSKLSAKVWEKRKSQNWDKNDITFYIFFLFCDGNKLPWETSY